MATKITVINQIDLKNIQIRNGDVLNRQKKSQKLSFKVLNVAKRNIKYKQPKLSKISNHGITQNILESEFKKTNDLK